ncbi:transposase [Psychromonas ingrahamii]|uniref:transposase n=1 Tax=Psychromonas ingrahamii TaxID=357794 RepID=UPI0000D80A08
MEDILTLYAEPTNALYPVVTEASKICVVMDDFGTHKPSALYKAYPPEEARRILNKLEFHYTLKHASWFNMVEIEIGVMSKQCLDRRIPDMDTLKFELSAWESKRSEAKETINWMFDVCRTVKA